jgi:hypothetical protein
VSRVVLVDPVAATAAAPSPAQTLLPVGPGPVALADAMLNPGAGWGDGILDAVHSSLSRWNPPIRTERVRRSHGVDAPGPEAWASAMAAVYRAIVIATGD